MATLNEFKPRLPVSVLSDKIIEVLPEHYSTDYPDLVRFLEIYYEYLNKESTGFSNIIQSLYQIRDIDSTSLANLNLLFQEIGKLLLLFIKTRVLLLRPKVSSGCFLMKKPRSVIPKIQCLLLTSQRLVRIHYDIFKMINDTRFIQF